MPPYHTEYLILLYHFVRQRKRALQKTVCDKTNKLSRNSTETFPYPQSKTQERPKDYPCVSCDTVEKFIFLCYALLYKSAIFQTENDIKTESYTKQQGGKPMQFRFETAYNQQSLSIMAKCLRKTVRKSKSKRSHIAGWIIVALAIFLSFASGESGIDLRKIVTWTAAAVIVIALLFEDQMNGYFARKRLLKGTEYAVATFDPEISDSFVSETTIGKSEFSYDKILLIAETQQYFVFLFSASHAQIYDKDNLTGGSVNDFRNFISEKTGKPIVPVR